MPLQNLYLEPDSLRVGNNQLTLQSNAVYIGNNLTIGNTVVIGQWGGVGAYGIVEEKPYGTQNKLVITANSPDPTGYSGAIDLRVATANGKIGITFDSRQNGPSDFGYIYYWDNHPAYAPLTGETGTLVIGINNDIAGAGSDDVIAVESTGNIMINPGMGTDVRMGATSWNQAAGNLFVGNNSVKYYVLHEGLTAATTLRTNITLTGASSGAQIALNNATSNWISWGNGGVAAPAVSTRSAGTKLMLYSGLSSTSVDYAIGIESATMWFSVPNTGSNFRWYANTTVLMSANSASGLVVNAAFSAITKSFLIDHPTKPGKTLRHGSLEGPENGVYVRGRLKDEDTITLPEYWTALIDTETITVNLTPVGHSQSLFVKNIANNTITVGAQTDAYPIDCFFTVFAERKDVPKLVVEE